MLKGIVTLTILTNIIFVLSVSKEKCSLITCNESANGNTGTCLEVTNNSLTGANNWLFNKCASGYYCKDAQGYPDKIATYKCEAVPDNSDYIEFAKFCRDQHPGEPCNFNEHCESKVCKNHVCVGAKLDEACSKNVDCGIGMYCSGSRCTSLKTIGSSCNNDFECANDLGCIDGKCVEYFTQAVGTEVDNPQLCNFNIARTGTNGKYICDALILEKEECGEGQDKCTYRWFKGNTLYETDCQCDPTRRTQNRMCPHLIEANRPYLYTEKHSERRFNATCDSVGRQFKTNCTGLTIFGEEGWAEISSSFIFSNVMALILFFILV